MNLTTRSQDICENMTNEPKLSRNLPVIFLKENDIRLCPLYYLFVLCFEFDVISKDFV